MSSLLSQGRRRPLCWQGHMPDPTYGGQVLHSPLSLTRAALPRLLLQSQAASVLPTEGAGSPLHAVYFRLRGFSTKLWQHVRTSPDDSAAVSTTPHGHPNQQMYGHHAFHLQTWKDLQRSTAFPYPCLIR